MIADRNGAPPYPPPFQVRNIELSQPVQLVHLCPSSSSMMGDIVERFFRRANRSAFELRPPVKRFTVPPPGGGGRCAVLKRYSFGSCAEWKIAVKIRAGLHELCDDPYSGDIILLKGTSGPEFPSVDEGLAAGLEILPAPDLSGGYFFSRTTIGSSARYELEREWDGIGLKSARIGPAGDTRQASVNVS
jgi:hypothetical protein